jgi:hypothetical protein
VTGAERNAIDKVRREIDSLKLDLQILKAGERVVGRAAITGITRRHRLRGQREFEAYRPSLTRGPWPGQSVRIVG